MQKQSKKLLGVTTAVFFAGLINGYLAIVPGLVLIVWGAVATVRSSASPLSMLYGSGARSMGMATAGMGVLFMMCGTTSLEADKGLARKKAAEAAVTTDTRREPDALPPAPTPSNKFDADLPAKLELWEARKQEIRGLGDAKQFDRGLALVESTRTEIKTHGAAMSTYPTALRELDAALELEKSALVHKSSVEAAAQDLTTALKLARTDLERKDWYAVAGQLEVVRASLGRLDAVPADTQALVPKDLVAAARTSLQTMERQLGSRAPKPADLTVRQYITAPETIRTEAVRLRWLALANEPKLDAMVKTVRTAGVEDDAKKAILHCADGVAKKDRTLMATYRELIRDIDSVASPQRPARELIDVCAATFLAMTQM